MWMDFLGWAQLRSFNCDMYWPLLNMYWESSGFGLEVFNIRGALTNRGGNYMYVYPHVFGVLFSSAICRPLSRSPVQDRRAGSKEVSRRLLHKLPHHR